MTLDLHTDWAQCCSQCSAGTGLLTAQPQHPHHIFSSTGASSAYKPSMEIFTHLGSFSGKLLPQVGSSRSLTVFAQKELGPCSGGSRAERAEPPWPSGRQPFHTGRSVTLGCPCPATHPPVSAGFFWPAYTEPLEQLKLADAFFWDGGTVHGQLRTSH